MFILKNFKRFMYSKTKHKKKKHICRYSLQCCDKDEILMKHTITCLKINRKQRVTLRNREIDFTNYSRQLAASFKIYADFDSNSKKAQYG